MSLEISPEACNFIKETLTQVFACEFCTISKDTFFYKTTLDNCFWIFYNRVCGKAYIYLNLYGDNRNFIYIMRDIF